jgi:adenosylcobinamide kinase/adenosylcobinamide-phosphate guanylyltransferase
MEWRNVAESGGSVVKKNEIILVTGGARSGKSDIALRLAEKCGNDIVFVATAQAGDEDMRMRIEAHKSARSVLWKTIEAPVSIGKSLSLVSTDTDAVILDCLTMLVSNILLAQGEEPDEKALDESVRAEIDSLIAECARLGCTLIIVTNETGMGIVPEYRLARIFRDSLGRANKYIASKADKVLLMVAGLAVDVKKLALDAESL